MLIAEGIVGSEQLALLAARVPIALIAAYPDELHVDVIGADNRSGTKAAVCHMVEQHGRTRLFYIAGPAEAPDARERRSAFEEAVAEHPGATVAGFFEGRFAAVSGQLAVREILTGPRRELPDAIVCGNDQMAIGAMRELQAAGIRVPADVAVVGFDDMHLSALLAPPLTTVRQPMRLLGERACSRLLQRIADPSLPPQAERLPTELIIRESCGCGGRTAGAESARDLEGPVMVVRGIGSSSGELVAMAARRVGVSSPCGSGPGCRRAATRRTRRGPTGSAAAYHRRWRAGPG